MYFDYFIGLSKEQSPPLTVHTFYLCVLCVCDVLVVCGLLVVFGVGIGDAAQRSVGWLVSRSVESIFCISSKHIPGMQRRILVEESSRDDSWDDSG